MPEPFFYDSSFAYSGGLGWAGYMRLPQAGAEASADRVPIVREVTRSQVGRGNALGGQLGEKYTPGHGMLSFPVPISVNGAVTQFNGGQLFHPPRRRYSTYRIMDQQATLKLARKMLYWRILSSTWSFRGVDKDTPKEWIRLAKDMFTPLRYQFLQQALRYTSYGWKPFENIWTMRDGYHWLKRLKSLSNDMTNVLIDDSGNFVGLYQPLDKVTLRVDAYQAFKVTHDGDADDHYGTSRHESAYDPWIHWQQTRIDQLRLSDKLAGVIPILKFPPGSSQIDGQVVDNSILAQQIIDDLAHSTGVAFQAYEWDKNQIQRNPDLTKVTDWSIDFYDAGNLAPAQAGMIATAEYDDKQLLRAWETPERSAISANTGGAKADSEVHSDSGVSAVEMVDDDLADQATKGLMNSMLLCNLGEKAVDKVILEPAPHVERKRMAAQAFLKLLIVDPVIRTAILRCTDTNELIDLCEVPRNSDFNISTEELKAAAQMTNNGSSNPTGNAVSTGGSTTTVVGRTRGSITMSNGEVIEFKEIKDQLADLLECIKAKDEDEQ